MVTNVKFNHKMLGVTQNLIDAIYKFKSAARFVKWDEADEGKERAFNLIKELEPALKNAEDIMASQYRVKL